MSERDTHLIEVDGREYELEAIGTEIVVRDFTEPWANFCDMLRAPTGQKINKFLSPNVWLFSFEDPECKRLINEANDYFDNHQEEASEELDDKITAIAAAHIRKHKAK